MGRHYFCDICKFLGRTSESVWKIEDKEWMLHLDTHTKMELVLYIDYVINMLYENNGTYEIET